MTRSPGFWSQPVKSYRNFQVVFTLLTLNFALPALTYTFAPEVALEQFRWINQLLGGTPYTFPEEASLLWRMLAAANVMTLALMCFGLQWNLRRHYPMLAPLVFMKAYAALAWWGVGLRHLEYPLFLAAALLDTVTVGLFLAFAPRARRAIADVDPELLVPRPRRPWIGGETP